MSEVKTDNRESDVVWKVDVKLENGKIIGTPAYFKEFKDARTFAGRFTHFHLEACVVHNNVDWMLEVKNHAKTA